MVKRFILTLVLLVSINTAKSSTDSLYVLFIGNSITFVNNMPFMFQDIANNKGKNVAVTMYAPGGAGIVNHFTDANIYSLFRNNSWDIVVIQPGSNESSGSSYPVDTTIKRSRILLDSLYSYSPCAKVFLYQIPYGVPSATTYSSYFSVQTMIRDSVLKMSDSLKVQMIPAGECARAYYSIHPNLLLHNSFNDIHPSAYGSFLVASAFYAGIFQDTVSGSTYYSTIPQDSATNFFSIADTVVLNHLSGWRINNYNLHSDFNFSVNGSLVSFNCLSSNFSNVFWDFGDNSTSTINNPNHTYLSQGTFIVKLFSFNNNCSDSIFKQISIISTGEKGIHNKQNSILLSPNPASTAISLNNLDPSGLITYKILNIYGREVLKGSIKKSLNQIFIANIPTGLYLLQLFKDSEFAGNSKFIKTKN